MPRKAKNVPDVLPVCFGTQANLAQMLGCSARSVRDHIADGVIVADAEGKVKKYDLIKNAARFIERMRSRYDTQATKEKLAQSELRKSNADADYKERKAEIAALELARLRGELIPAEEVEFVITDIVLKMKAQLDGLRNRAPMVLTGITSKSEMYAAAGREIDAVLNEMADYRYDPEDFKRHKSATEDVPDDEEPKPAKPRKKAAKKTAAKKKTKQN